MSKLSNQYCCCGYSAHSHQHQLLFSARGCPALTFQPLNNGRTGNEKKMSRDQEQTQEVRTEQFATFTLIRNWFLRRQLLLGARFYFSCGRGCPAQCSTVPILTRQSPPRCVDYFRFSICIRSIYLTALTVLLLLLLPVVFRLSWGTPLFIRTELKLMPVQSPRSRSKLTFTTSYHGSNNNVNLFSTFCPLSLVSSRSYLCDHFLRVAT